MSLTYISHDIRAFPIIHHASCQTEAELYYFTTLNQRLLNHLNHIYTQIMPDYGKNTFYQTSLPKATNIWPKLGPLWSTNSNFLIIKPWTLFKFIEYKLIKRYYQDNFNILQHFHRRIGKFLRQLKIQLRPRIQGWRENKLSSKFTGILNNWPYAKRNMHLIQLTMLFKFDKKTKTVQCVRVV